MATDYVPPTVTAAAVRTAIREAQKAGKIAPAWKITVRTQRSSMCTEIAVTVVNATGMTEQVDGHCKYTEAARKLAAEVGAVMKPITDPWAAQSPKMRFPFLYLGDNGLLAP